MTAIVNKENMAELPGYQASTMKVITAHGGKPVSKFKVEESLSGDDSPEMLVVMEFPSAKSIKAMVEGEDFQALSELRARVFSKLNLMTCVSA